MRKIISHCSHSIFFNCTRDSWYSKDTATFLSGSHSFASLFETTNTLGGGRNTFLQHLSREPPPPITELRRNNSFLAMENAKAAVRVALLIIKRQNVTRRTVNLKLSWNSLQNCCHNMVEIPSRTKSVGWR